MNSTDVINRKVDELQKQVEEIEELGVKLLEEAHMDEGTTGTGLSSIDYRSSLKKLQRDAILKYQQWYSTAFLLVQEYAPEWVQIFVSCYSTSAHGSNGVIDYLELGSYSNHTTRNRIVSSFVKQLTTQMSILLSLPSVVETKEMSLRELIAADVARTEIEQAELLLDSGFERAAGSIAGVALELHLKTLCDVNNLSYPPKATIEPLAQALYKDNKLDITEFKRIQYLASIRNKCSHPEPVSTKEVRNLIDGVKKLV